MNNGLIEFECHFRREDGALGGAHLKLRDGKVHRTEKIVEDVLLADIDKSGKLIGIDILAAVELSVVIELIDDPKLQITIKKVLQNRIADLLTAA